MVEEEEGKEREDKERESKEGESEEREGKERESREREGKERESKRARNRLEDIPSSDDDQSVTGTKVNVRPRQRSFRRRAKQEFTNELTADQLVSESVMSSITD